MLDFSASVVLEGLGTACPRTTTLAMMRRTLIVAAVQFFGKENGTTRKVGRMRKKEGISKLELTFFRGWR